MAKIRRRFQVAFAALLIGAGILVAPAPAQAIPINCPIEAGGYEGWYKCVYGPLLVTWPDGHLQYFVVGTDWKVYENHEWWPGGSWSDWYPLDGQARSQVWITVLEDDAIEINVIGTYGHWHSKYWNASKGWTDWGDRGTPPRDRIVVGGQEGWNIRPYLPTPVTWPDGHRQWFVVGTDWRVWQNWELAPNSNVWSGWIPLDGSTERVVSRVSIYNVTDDFIRLDTMWNDGLPHCRTWTRSSGWDTWEMGCLG